MTGTTVADPEWSPRSVAVDDLVMVDGAAVAYCAGAVHVLNPTATLLWQSCDGDATLGTLATDFAHAFAVDPAVALADVIEAASELLDRGLLTTTDDVRPVDDPMPPILQPAPICSGCGDGPTFAQQVVVAVGDVALSIGADEEMAAALVAALGSRVRAHLDHPRERASYGLVIPAGTRDRGPADLARLHRGPDVLLTSRDPERVVRALIAQLATHAPPPKHVVLDAIAVGGSGRVVVAPMPITRAPFERGVARVGLRVSDASAVIVGLDPPVVVVGNPWPEIDLEPLTRVAAQRRHLGDEPGSLEWGTYELSAITVAGPANLASVLGELATTARPGVTASLTPLVELVAGVPIVSGSGPEAIASVLDVNDRVDHRALGVLDGSAPNVPR